MAEAGYLKDFRTDLCDKDVDELELNLRLCTIFQLDSDTDRRRALCHFDGQRPKFACRDRMILSDTIRNMITMCNFPLNRQPELLCILPACKSETAYIKSKF